MAWDESLFKSLYAAARGVVRGRADRAVASRACQLADVQRRLQLLACGVAGASVTVQAADGDGGWRDDVLLLPAALAFAPTPEANLAAYVLRVAYACTSRRLGFALDAAADPVARALLTWLAVPATRRALLDDLPGAAAAEAAARAAALAARPDLPRGAADVALETWRACTSAPTRRRWRRGCRRRRCSGPPPRRHARRPTPPRCGGRARRTSPRCWPTSAARAARRRRCRCGGG